MHSFLLHSFDLYYRQSAIDWVTYLVACHYSLISLFCVVGLILCITICGE